MFKATVKDDSEVLYTLVSRPAGIKWLGESGSCQWGFHL